MHTFTAESGIRFHHNGDFDGDIIIVKKVTESMGLDHRTTSNAILKLVRDNANQPNDHLIPFQGESNDGKNVPFVVSLEIIRAFVADRYISGTLTQWIESADDTFLLKLLPVVDAIRAGQKINFSVS